MARGTEGGSVGGGRKERSTLMNVSTDRVDGVSALAVIHLAVPVSSNVVA